MQKKLNRIYDGHMQALLFWMCWLVYFASYIGRLNYSSAMPAMIGGSVITASQAGFISMVYFLPTVRVSFSTVCWQTASIRGK